jgi:hypothetical protein
MKRNSSAPIVLWIAFLLFIHNLIDGAIILKNAIAGTLRAWQLVNPPTEYVQKWTHL